MRISSLPEELRILAEYNREQYNLKIERPYGEDQDELTNAFEWKDSPEGIDFWVDICIGAEIRKEEIDDQIIM